MEEETNGGGTDHERYDWTAIYDDEEGRLYYYNSVTEESSWDPPEDGCFNPPPEEERPDLMDVTQEEAPSAQAAESTMLEDSTPATQETSETPWSAHYDDDGRIYYYNNTTEESVWDPPPEGFLPPPPLEEEEAAAAAPTQPTTTTAPWIAYQDEEGRDYYYNEESGETQWDPPDSFRHSSDIADDTPMEPSNDDEAEKEIAVPPSTMDATDAMEEEEEEKATRLPVSAAAAAAEDSAPSPVIEEEEEIPPAIQRLRAAEAALEQPDSVLEPDCMQHVSEVVAADAGNPTRAISALIDHYQGQTAVCGLLARWHCELRSKKDTRRVDTPPPHADAIRNVVTDVIYKVAKERFSKEVGDTILDLSKSEAAFLEDMMDSPRWRKLLIDLTAAHKDSAVLLYCLRAISKRGHHREIAQRINQSDHFAVFNAMLVSELTVIGQQAVQASSDLATATQFSNLIQDLVKACSSTSYTYLYSIQLLRRLEQLAKTEFLGAEPNMAGESNPSNGEYPNNSIHGPRLHFRRVIRKWEALSQILESSMMMDPSNGSMTGSSHLLRKRQLDVALTIGELYQRQQREKRRKIAQSNGYDRDHEEEEDSTLKERLELALTSLLKRHSMGMAIDDSILDKLLPTGLDMNNTGGVGELLVQYPVAVRALLAHLYRPGPTRITSPSTKNKCARLIVLAMFAAEKSVIEHDFLANREAIDYDRTLSDELEITKNIVQGSVYCEQLETMISFLVTTESSTGSAPTTSTLSHRTIGEKLCALALNVTPVGLGVAIWAREFTQGKEYAASASYPTLSPSILSLVRLVAMKHPFARADALHVGLAFLRHSNADISYQKVNSIKECGLRLLIFLMIRGDVVPVFSSLLSRVQQVGSSELDASLIRYFVAGVLEVVQPPVSPIFVQMLGSFLTAPKVMDAVRSSYFSESNRRRLKELLSAMANNSPVDPPTYGARENTTSALVSTLLSAYK